MSRIFWCLFFTAWPIVAVVFCAISPQMDWAFPGNREAATPLGARIDDLFYLILGIVTIAFIGTMVALSYALWKASKNEDEKGWFSHGSHNLEVIWTIIPSGILLFIALYQMDVWAIYRVRDYDLGRQDGPRRMDVGEHVDPPDRLPAVVAEVDPTRHKDPGIGTEEVDRTDT